ncbi:acyl-CoA thioesterase [Lonsdalea quercina]|uniref:acyl-CoA thioesterase n=1 Tax=Lonsdalea quercina TaxID=71657 RepID=UPI0039755AB4
MCALNDPRLSHDVEITVSFHDCDPMGVVWHGHYFRFFEVAREALLSKFNYGYREMKASGYVWPVVDTRVKYRSPLTYEQRIRVRATVEEVENRLRIAYQIFDVESGQRTTTGYTIQVAVEEGSQTLSFVSPDILLERLGVTL